MPAALQPRVIVLGGPNGAGKSTAAAHHRLLSGVTFVNADEIAKTLPTYPSPAADLQAGRLLLEELEALERRRRDFAVETTLAGRALAQRIAALRKSGYLFHLVYVWVPSPEISIARVADRVRRGGHNIAEPVIRRRYYAGLKNLFQLYMPLADVWEIIDNSRGDEARVLAEGGREETPRIRDPFAWRKVQEGVNDEPS